jgi:hypothetical protein
VRFTTHTGALEACSADRFTRASHVFYAAPHGYGADLPFAARFFVTCLQHWAFLLTGMTFTSRQFRELEPTILMRPEEKKPVWRLVNSKRPSLRSAPQNGKQIGRQGDHCWRS